MTEVAAPVMIYHTPYPLDRTSVSGSGIRPVRMREAFEAEGYEVWEVTGHSRERAIRIREAKRRIRAGARPQFAYTESSTMPTPLTDPHHLPMHPWLDASFLRFCREHGVPTGIFYRDIYWQFPEYLKAVNPLVAKGTRFFYRRDLRLYRRAMDRIFLPSDRMAQYLPAENRAQCTPLPPGAESIDQPQIAHEGIELLFVGSLGDYYRAHECVRGVALAQDAHLTICTREVQWQALKHEYEGLLAGATDIVHRSGDGLLPLFASADVGVLFLEPIEYREFAVPLKLFEYLGYGKPIVATEGTMVGEFVAAHGIGWVIPYEAQALADLLDRLVANPEELAALSERCRQVRNDHTWRARARQAAEVLMTGAAS